MTLISRLAAVVSITSALGFAASWSGYLVDAKCYSSQQRNARDGLNAVEVDRGFEVKACAPSVKTQSFTVVLDNGESFKLDAAGNANAAGLVRKSIKRSLVLVDVAGEREEGTVKVHSISLVR
jgi:hypothetical protein